MRSLFDRPSSNEPAAPTAPAKPTLRPDGQRACAVCGAPASFGFGVRLLHDREGRWACRDHREAVEAMRET